ncbi:MAG: SpoIID/LytB domain, partial [Frankiales bacterium]|nr:SpoIID/LytB domain [Frankiales bacterium]
DDDVVVRPAPGLAITDADGARFVLPVGPSAWRVVADPATGQHVFFLAGTWQPWIPPDGRQVFNKSTFTADDRIRLDLPDGSARAYRGSLIAERGVGTALTTVNVVGFEQYLWGVVPRESPASFHVEALRAQSVAARTYAAWKRANSAQPSYDICSTTACQVYGGSALWAANGTFTELEDARTRDAVNATAGQVLLYGGRPAFTEFSSSTGGWTTAGSVPYLVAGEDPYDDFSGNPVHTWRTTAPLSSIAAAWPSVGTPRWVRILARDGRGQWGGRVTSLRVEGTAGSVTISGDEFRSRLGLRSTWFVLDAGLIQYHWLVLGGSASYLGRPTSGEYPIPGGVAQNYEGGRIAWSPATGAWAMRGLILNRYDSFGGSGSVLGLPVSDEVQEGAGRVSFFVNGAVYWSPATGAQVVQGLIQRRYQQLGGATSVLGLPVSDEVQEGAGRVSSFVNGAIYWSPATGAQAVQGLIQRHYQQLGGATSVLGLPVSDEEAVQGGRQSRFLAGRMYWSPGTGAREVHGLILDRYLGMGGPGSFLGLPTSDEFGVPGGRSSSFSGGQLFWSPSTGTHEVRGMILASYAAAGGPGSSLGLPVSDEYAVPGGRRSDFVGGALVWDAQTLVVTRVPR